MADSWQNLIFYVTSLSVTDMLCGEHFWLFRIKCSACCKPTTNDENMMRFHITQFFDCSQSLQMHLNLLLSSHITDQSIDNPLILLHRPSRSFNLSNYQPRQDVTQLTLAIWTNDGWVYRGFADDVMMFGITWFVCCIFQADKPSASDPNSQIYQLS